MGWNLAIGLTPCTTDRLQSLLLLWQLEEDGGKKEKEEGDEGMMLDYWYYSLNHSLT